MNAELAQSIPPAVQDAYGLHGAHTEPITIGLINRTYHVRRRGAPALALQRLHPIFAAEVNLDIDAVTRHLEGHGLDTPRVVPTASGALWLEEDGIWRALTWLDGRVFTEVPSATLAHAAGRLTGAFHTTTATLEHTFHFQRAGVHDTARHLQRLRDAVREQASAPNFAQVEPVAAAILGELGALELTALQQTPQRIVHGDLKLSNVLFQPSCDEGRALLDLDTLAHGTLPVELGDALRSWCNPAGESAPEAHLDVELFTAAIAGYAAAAGALITADERALLVRGVLTISLELAARFCTDALEDRYFGWDSSRFPSRRAHNLVRARSQLALGRSIAAGRPALERAVTAAFAQAR